MGNNGSGGPQDEHHARLRGILKRDVDVMRAVAHNQPTLATPVPIPIQLLDPTKPRQRTHSIRFDEVNIKETLHPTDKDYGHMKIDEPKTPFEPMLQDLTTAPGGVNTGELIAKLAKLPQNSGNDKGQGTSPVKPTDDQIPETAGFREARKLHYNSEFTHAQEAKKLIEMEFGEDNTKKGKAVGKK